MSGKVCVFGAFNVDVVARLSRFPRPGESLIANGSLMGAGGKGANQALAAARAGAKVHYIGKSFYDTAFIHTKIAKTKVHFDKKITKKPHSEKRYLAILAKRKKKLTKLDDKLKNGNWMMGSFGEYPSILDKV